MQARGQGRRFFYSLGPGPRAGSLGSSGTGKSAVHPPAVRPASLAAARVLRAAPLAPRRQEASTARPQMSLPLRLPYCCPARRWRGALWLAYFSAPVTPPLPSPASRASTRSSKAALRRAARRRQPGSQAKATEGAPPRGCTGTAHSRGVLGLAARPPRHPGRAACPLAPPLPLSE